jgi:predicted DNA binding protein
LKKGALVEVWKPLIYHGDLLSNWHEVSSEGRIRNTRTGTIYKLARNKKGYLQVCLTTGTRSSRQAIRVHRAVAETFLVKEHEEYVVNHKDGNKENNRVDNLEWCSLSENTLHAIRIGLIDTKKTAGERSGHTKFTKEQVEAIRAAYRPGDRLLGTRGIARITGVDHMTISRIVRREVWKD